MYMLWLVLDDSAKLNEVLAAWDEAGAPGITILESTGLNRVLTRLGASAAFAGFGAMFGSGQIGHHTLFTIIPDLDLAQTIITATEAVLGSLKEPNTGIAFALPVAQTWGKPNA
ncbi:MAG: hypothetical protein IPL78_28095 [Chloroflexi bacterium]|nr:hypothetical protein [Chloroflexota bacterium]